MIQTHHRVFLRGLLVTLSLLTAAVSAADDEMGNWAREYLGEDKNVRFYPDGYANYWSYHLDRSEKHAALGLTVSGEYPAVRYLSINVYDDDNMSLVASVSDADLSIVDGRYSLKIVPSDSEVSGEGVLRFPAHLKRVSVFLRYYLAEGDTRGGKSLPAINAFDTNSGQTAHTPSGEPTFGDAKERKKLEKLVLDTIVYRRIKPVLDLGEGPQLDSFRVGGGGMYANLDSSYLALPVAKTSRRVAVLRFRPPVPAGNEDTVRYWSLSLGDEQTYNHWTVHDGQVTAAADGYVYFVVADNNVDEPRLPETFVRRGWDRVNKAMFIYRNLLTTKNYSQAISNVPAIRGSTASAAQPAREVIGDYAPQGRLVSKKAFENAESLATLFTTS